MKKILITGVYASGKTSLIKLLEERLIEQGKNVLVIQEVARSCPLKLNTEQNLNSTFWLIMSQIENEINSYDNKYDYIIFDRGIPDIISHTMIVLGDSKEDLLIMDKLKTLGISSLKNFDHIFFTKKSDNYLIEKDQLRIDNRSLQELLEKHHFEYLDEINCNMTILDEHNTDRLNHILNLI
ncbi:AAA family ATPase [Photobacterium leiognathi]|uniref:AAA family ATPase n=1 Tax=Photobacterium leiognathi TaxID=553611 RepID=UPI0027370EA1|nr:AAA family ATPase [Photobacterium leiognathi]